MKYVWPLLLAIILVGCGSPNASNENTKEGKGSPATEEQQDDVETESRAKAQFHGMHFRLGIEDVTVTGKAKATNNEIFYVVNQGDNPIVEETKITLDEEQEEWTDLEIKFPLTEEMENSDDTLVVGLYGKNDEGKQINPNYLPIDLNLKFYKKE